jgi:hypothetical protein
MPPERSMKPLIGHTTRAIGAVSVEYTTFGTKRREGRRTMWDILFWIYLTNAVLLILHEIDSAYWKEWELLRLPGGISGFLLVHVPILPLVLYGLVLVSQRTFSGLVLSLILSLAGVFAFAIHSYFIRRGHEEFKMPISVAILVATLTVSLVQSTITIYLLVQG